MKNALDLDIEQYRKWAFSISNISGKHLNRNVIKNRFPELYKRLEIDNPIDKIVWLYNVLHDIVCIPSCVNCGKDVNFKNFKVGYRKFCSNACVNEFNSKSSVFSESISTSRQKKYDEIYFTRKYKWVKEKRGEDFLVSGYCEHEDFLVNKNRFIRSMLDGNEICEKCATKKSSQELKYSVDEENTSLLSSVVFKRNFPEAWGKIDRIHPSARFREKKFMFFRNLTHRPLCPVCNEREREFVSRKRGYSQTCTNYACSKSSSGAERDILSFVKSLGIHAESRYMLDKNEIDVFVPSCNIGIEYNGLYWHSDIHRKIDYHVRKNKFFESKGIQLLNIWEDDWTEKRALCESLIANKLGLSKRIHARKCEVKEISYKESATFVEENHLQGKSIDKVRYGLFFNEKLVSVMTFGKRRMIMHSKESSGWELMRFCTLKNLVIVGGASKLFKKFENDHSPKEIMSYASCDISNGNVYKKMGFELEHRTSPGFWWCKNGKKYHRSNFMKHLVAKTDEEKKLTAKEIMEEKGYYRVWNSGNLKYVWKIITSEVVRSDT